jgi:Fe-S-cluster containining protein
MKNALGISSESLLDRYTVSLTSDSGFPVVFLKMCNDELKSCPFVTPRGCEIYADRPWACRIYPLKPESTKLTEKADKTYYSVMDVSFCLGLNEDTLSTVSVWQQEQGIPIYLEMEKIFKKITMNEFLLDKKILNQKIREMIYMACYDLDRFKRFVLESTFLKRFETDQKEVEKIRRDDTALYKFAMKWIEYGLIGQQIFKVKPTVMTEKRRELAMR